MRFLSSGEERKFLSSSLVKMENLLYVSPNSYGEISYQQKNLEIPLKEVSTEEFLTDVFGDFQGNLCIFQKKSNGSTANVFYKKKDTDRMFIFLQKTFGIDTYISYSTYYKSRRTQKDEVLRTQNNIVHTYMLVQDLDYYKIGMSDAECLGRLGKMIREGELLCPNYIVSTGQGYQLIWLVEPFKNISGYTNDKDWRNIQEFLYQKLKPFNSDVVVKNPSAVTRLPGTRHRTSKNIVSAYLANQARFTLKDFIFYHEIIPAADRLVKPKKIANKKPSVSRMTVNWNEFTLNRQREEDIFIFVRTQNERSITYIGIRNWLGLVLRFHALVSSDGDYAYAKNRVLELCTEMDMTDTSETEILRRSQLAEKYYADWLNDTWDKEKYFRGGLFYTNARMLELMNIKSDYYIQWKMKTIKIKNKAYEAARKRFEKFGEEDAEQHTWEAYQERRKQKFNEEGEDKLWQLKQALERQPNASQRQLAKHLGWSVSTVNKYTTLIGKK